MAFFLESTFVGLFFFGWDRLTKHQHLAVTWLVALGSNFCIVDLGCEWLDAKPGASDFNFETMRMEMLSFRISSEPGCSGEIRSYRRCRLCYRRDVYLNYQFLLSVERT